MKNGFEVVFDEINAHISKEGNGYRNWVVGFSDHPRKSLFAIHNVDLENAWWIYRPANSVEEAQKILMNFKSQGAEIVNQESGKFVFAYKKTAVTA